MGDGRRALVVRWRQSELEKKDLQVLNQGKVGFLQPKILINNKSIVIYYFFQIFEVSTQQLECTSNDRFR